MFCFSLMVALLLSFQFLTWRTADGYVDKPDYQRFVTNPPFTKMVNFGHSDLNERSVSIQDDAENHLCTGTLLTGKLTLTTCKCAHVYDYDERKYELFDGSKHRLNIAFVNADLCNVVFKSASTIFVSKAVTDPQCRMLDGWPEIWINDVAVLYTYMIFGRQFQPLPIPYNPNTVHKISKNLADLFRSYPTAMYSSWRTFHTKLTTDSLHISDFKFCVESYKKYNVTFPPQMEHQLYCSDQGFVSDAYQPCFGQEGAVAKLNIDDSTAYFMLTYTGRCMNNKLPAIFTRLDDPSVNFFIRSYMEAEKQDNKPAPGFVARNKAPVLMLSRLYHICFLYVASTTYKRSSN